MEHARTEVQSVCCGVAAKIERGSIGDRHIAHGGVVPKEELAVAFNVLPELMVTGPLNVFARSIPGR